MSPVKETAPRSVVIAVVTSLLGIAAVVALIVFVLAQSSGSGNVEVRLGTERFEAGPAEQRADAIRRDGPILFTDAAGGTRDIYLQHEGESDTEGWLAFDARRPGTGRECTLQWQPEAANFLDPCDETIVPSDGEGLLHYPVEVTEEGQLIIDVRSASA